MYKRQLRILSFSRSNPELLKLQVVQGRNGFQPLLYGSPYGRYGEAAFGGSTSPKDGGSALSGPSDDMIALRHLRAGGGDCVGRSVARWSSFMHVSVYLEAESPCQFPVFQTTHFGALVRLLFHELLGLQLRRLLRWSSIGRRARGFTFCVHFY